MSQEEFEAAVIRKPELLKFMLIDNPMELLDKVQKAIDALPNSSEKESRQRIVDELRDFYNQRLDRIKKWRTTELLI